MVWSDANQHRMQTGMGCGVCGLQKHLTADGDPGQGLMELHKGPRGFRQGTEQQVT